MLCSIYLHYSYHTECDGKTSRICSERQALCSEPMSVLGQTIAVEDTGPCCWQVRKTLERQQVSVPSHKPCSRIKIPPCYQTCTMGKLVYLVPVQNSYFSSYVWQNRTLEVRPDRLPPEFDMGLNPTNPALLTTIPVSNPMAPLAVPQPGHAIDPLTRPMSALSVPDAAPSPGFFAPSPFGPSPPNWGNSGAHSSTMNRQLFVGNVCIVSPN
jgi:hypothetical protein